MRPGASPCGGPSALSWSRAALRGLKPAPAWTVMGSVRPARRFDAHQALASTSLPNRLASDGGPPCASALLQRPIATPPHRPAWSEDRHVGRCFLSWAFSPYDTSGAEDPYRSSFRLDRVPRPGFQTPIAASTSVPSGARRRRSVHGLHPSRLRSARRAGVLSDASALLSFTASIRRIPRGCDGRGRLQGLAPGAQPCVVEPLAGPAAPLPSWDSSLQSVLPPRPGHRFGSRRLPPHAFGGVTSHSACVSRSSGARRSARPSRDRRLSWDSPPFDRRGIARTDSGHGPMGWPSRSRALQAARTSLCILDVRPTGAFASARRRRPSVDGCLPLPFVRAD